MRRTNRLRLRNKIIKHLNGWQQLGCMAREFSTSPAVRGRDRNRFIWRLVSGVAKDGRAILIYPIRDRREKVPKLICELMMQYEGRQAIVGCALHIGDAWDIVSDNEAEYKRKQQTYSYRYWHQKLKGEEE